MYVVVLKTDAGFETESYFDDQFPQGIKQLDECIGIAMLNPIGTSEYEPMWATNITDEEVDQALKEWSIRRELEIDEEIDEDE
jgi:hypothetical protein